VAQNYYYDETAGEYYYFEDDWYADDEYEQQASDSTDYHGAQHQPLSTVPTATATAPATSTSSTPSVTSAWVQPKSSSNLDRLHTDGLLTRRYQPNAAVSNGSITIETDSIIANEQFDDSSSSDISVIDATAPLPSLTQYASFVDSYVSDAADRARASIRIAAMAKKESFAVWRDRTLQRNNTAYEPEQRASVRRLQEQAIATTRIAQWKAHHLTASTTTATSATTTSSSSSSTTTLTTMGIAPSPPTTTTASSTTTTVPPTAVSNSSLLSQAIALDRRATASNNLLSHSPIDLAPPPPPPSTTTIWQPTVPRTADASLMPGTLPPTSNTTPILLSNSPTAKPTLKSWVSSSRLEAQTLKPNGHPFAATE
jgi:hypothetical protein